MTRTTAPSWTEAEDEWLRECYPRHSNAELAAFKALDGWPHDRETLRTAMLYARVTRARVDAERKARIAAGRPCKGDIRPDERNLD